MTPERAKELLPIITAFAEGKKIEVFFDKSWGPCPDPTWNISYEYRIKPEPREWWIAGNVLFSNPAAAAHYLKSGFEIIHVLEVLE